MLPMQRQCVNTILPIGNLYEDYGSVGDFAYTIVRMSLYINNIFVMLSQGDSVIPNFFANYS